MQNFKKEVDVFFRNILRPESDTISKVIMIGATTDARCRGRLGRRWTQDAEEWTG